MFDESDKFAILAVQDVHSAIQAPNETQLSDGSLFLGQIPFDLNRNWKEWIGTLRLEQLRLCNFVLVRKMPSENPEILDGEHNGLGEALTRLFLALQLSGIVEYEDSTLFLGSYLGVGPNVRSIISLERYRTTTGSTSPAIDLPRLERAIPVRDTILRQEQSGSFDRFRRGLRCFKWGLTEKAGADRLHSFVRAIEALLLPAPGRTRNQFIHRCQTFVSVTLQNRDLLAEIYDMRSDTEHIHPWDRSLTSHSVADRNDIALRRTRQAEELARSAYERILEEAILEAHFRDDGSIDQFWAQDDHVRRGQWAHPINLAAVP